MNGEQKLRAIAVIAACTMVAVIVVSIATAATIMGAME